MKTQRILLLFVALSFGLLSCDVDQTQEGELPEVDVDIETEAGQLPAYDVDWADVDVRTTTKMVEVPKIRVVMEEEEIEVPVIDVDMPNDDDKEEMTLVAAAEVSGESRSINIVDVYATQNNLYVISELKKTGENLGDERMRVEDQVMLNAPELNVVHYIIGERPDGNFNKQYRYISDRSAINDKLDNSQKIWGR